MKLLLLKLNSDARLRASATWRSGVVLVLLAAAIVVVSTAAGPAARAAHGADPAAPYATGAGGTLGRTSVGASSARGGQGFLDVSGPYALPSLLTGMSAYVRGGLVPTPLRLVVYAD